MSDVLESLVSSGLRRDALALFLLNPNSWFHIRDASRRLSSSPNAVKAELERLERAGILRSVSRGNMRFFAADRGCPVFLELAGLVFKSMRHSGKRVKEAQKGTGNGPEWAPG